MAESYDLPPGDYVGNDGEGEVAFSVPAGGTIQTDDPRVQAVIQSTFLGNPEPGEPEVHDETGAVVGEEPAPEPEPETQPEGEEG